MGELDVLDMAVEFMEGEIIWNLVSIGIILADLMGIAIIFMTLIRGIIRYFRRDETVRLFLGKGMATALSFLLTGEVLRTVYARDWKEIGLLGAIIAFRVILTILLHWEASAEEKRARKAAKKTEIQPAEKAAPDVGAEEKPVRTEDR